MKKGAWSKASVKTTLGRAMPRRQDALTTAEQQGRPVSAMSTTAVELEKRVLDHGLSQATDGAN